MRTPVSPRHTGTVLALLSLSLILTFPTVAGAAEKPATAPSPAAQYQALTQEHQKAQEDFFKVYQAAKTDEEHRKIAATYPQPQKYAGRFLELAQKNPTDPAAVDALVWLVTSVRFGAEVEKAMDILMKDHLESEKLGLLCQSLAYSQTPETEKQLRDIIAKNPHHDVQGQAKFSLAMILKSQAGTAPQAEDLYEQIVKQFADVKGNPTLADQAKSQLFEIRTLGVGKPAPEIEGQDVEGKAFKLSDYRGQVVLIDFWGDW